MLPGRNGFQICADPRAAGDWTPILVRTAKDGELDEAEALDAGPTTTSRSPPPSRFSSSACTRCSDAHLARPHPGQRRAWRDDEGLTLTTRAFDVLEFLVRRAGQVLSKGEILVGV